MKAAFALLALLAGCSKPVEPLPAPGTSSGAPALTSPQPSSVSSSPGTAAPAEVHWRNATVVFESQRECRLLLGSSDAFTKAMSAFDRGVRTGRKDPVSEAEVLSFAAAQCLEWQEQDMQAWRTAAAKLGTALAGLQLELPERIPIFVTSGKEEFAAAYTRGSAIVLPVNELSSARVSLLAHELFHVASRYRPIIRDAIYALFGFSRVERFVYPSTLEPLRITNPDAYHYEHAVAVADKDGEIKVVPILQAAKPLADAIGADIGALVSVQLLDATNQPPRVRPAETTDYLERVSINSPYAIHPEELAADNFAHVVTRRLGEAPKVRNVEVLDALEKKL